MRTKPNALIDSLRSQLGGPRDGALLRFSLANALLATDVLPEAVEQLRAALGFDPNYSAAWKLLGLTLTTIGDLTCAADAFRNGIDTALARGDKQAEKEMRVFLRRLEKKEALPQPRR